MNNWTKTIELTLKRPFIQFEVQVFNLSVDVHLSNSANKVFQHLCIHQKLSVDHSQPNINRCKDYDLFFEGGLSEPYLIYFAIKLHNLCRLHEFLLKSAPHSLPVFPLPTNQQFEFPRSALSYKIFEELQTFPFWIEEEIESILTE